MDDNKIIDDLNRITKLTALQVFNVICVNCCKYYLAPTTATCGHTLCHSCWRLRHTCPSCGSNIEKKNLKLNIVLQGLTENVIILKETFEELFQINLDEMSLETAENQHVSEWLASSHNQFSAQVSTSQDVTSESIKVVEQITSEAQIHTKNNKINAVEKEIIHKNYQQIDWDKIEEMPDMEVNEGHDNIVGPMDIETFNFMDTKENASNNLRRSSRKKDLQSKSTASIVHDITKNTNIEKILNRDTEKKSNKSIQNWSNVKRMKRDLGDSKNKNTNKLNVSLEKYKKTLNSPKNTHVVPMAQQEPHDTNDNTVAVNVNDNSKLVSPKKLILKDDNYINKEINKNRATVVSTDATMNTSNSNDLRKHSTVLAFNSVKQNNDTDLQHNDEICVNKNVQYSKVSFFKRGPLNNKSTGYKITQMETNNAKNINTSNTDNIEISIRIGNTLTNICIKKKENDVQFKINSDQAIQTSLSKSSLNVDPKVSVSCSMNEPSMQHIDNDNNVEKGTAAIVPVSSDSPAMQIVKSKSTNKNTASADTSTICLEINESVEKGLVDNLENLEDIQGHGMSKNLDVVPMDEELLNDADLFDGESVKEGNIALLKSFKNTPSEILPTSKSIAKTQRNTYKRARDNSDMKDFSNFKKTKISQKNLHENISEVHLKENFIHDVSQPITYDSLMSQVFANIDADIKNLPKNAKHNPISNIEDSNFNNNKSLHTQAQSIIISQKDHINQKFSENLFSLQEKEDLHSESLGKIDQIKEISGYTKASNYISVSDVDMELNTPVQEDDEKSVVEETPQKNESFPQTKSKVEVGNLMDTAHNIIKVPKSINDKIQKQNVTNTENISTSHLLHETNNTKNITMEAIKPTSSLETNTPITKFVDHIKYKSTPLARKSLNFQLNNVDYDPEETLVPSSHIVIKTTQDKEFMSKAFEQNLNTPTQTLLVEKNRWKSTKLCIACSCLTLSEKANLNRLCFQRNWSFIDKYSKDLTHLVVGVDEENKAQRSVKYMCTLASGKWIVSYQWVEKCLQAKGFVDAEPFEALDFTGEPGPRRSRLSKQKLFQGITFYCMPPFTILDVLTLKDILEMSGGRVVDDVRYVRVMDAPAMLLAEPENTQEDRFIYLAMKLNVVPVNYEWMLNCLGSYTLSPINELLLCPESLLPPATSNWPLELLSRCYE